MVQRGSSAMWQYVSFPLFPWLWSYILSIGKGGCERVGILSYWVRLDIALQGALLSALCCPFMVKKDI